jgi:hypothetical protein
MPPDEWQTHPHQRGTKRSDYTAPPSQTALDNRRSPSADQIGDTSLMEEATDDSEPESRSRRQSPFDGYRFEIPRGVPWGELTAVRSEDGVPRLFYRRTFNIVGLVASAVSILVLLAGSVVSLFLALDGRDLLAGTAMGITLVFTVGILLLVPRRSLAILGDPEHGTLAMRVRETTLPGLPNPTFEVSIAEGSTIGYLIKRTLVSFPSRQWKILGPEGEPIGKAKEDGLIRPFFRKFLGDLFGVLTTDYRIVSNGATICRFLRRGDVRRFHALTLEKSADPTPDTRLLLAFAFVIDLLEKSR